MSPARYTPKRPLTSLRSHQAGRIEGLDGLRALAVIAVLSFHLWPSAVPGGFIGVDVFFVISGFLITTLLLRERRAAGGVDLVRFWTRRARRLLPALVVVLVSTVGVARLASGDLLVDIERQTLGAVTFSTNWLEIFAGSDYFDHTSPSLFANFWSLAVEEQFYLVWPLVFVAVGLLGSSARKLARIAIVAALASALLMVISYESGESSTRAYYGTHTHAFGLMIGVSLAYAFAAHAKLLGRRGWEQMRQWIGFVAFAGLFALIFALGNDSSFTYRGGLVLASLCSAVMVAALPGGPSTYQSLLKVRPLAWIGERSYGLYLWHWPVLLIVAELLPPTRPGSDANPPTVVLVIAATLALTEASYRWVETPIRRDGFRASGAAFISWLGRATGPGGRVRPFAVASVAGLVVAVAGVGFATAPTRSEAQQSVEAGIRLIEAQQNLESPAALVQEDRSVEPGSAPGRDGPAWPSALRVPPGDRLVALGDSVLSGAAPAMYERFPGIRLEAEPILQWHDAPQIVDRLLAEGAMRDVVVLNFGTNAGLGEEVSRQALRDVLDTLGPTRRVVLVTVVGTSYWVPSTNATMREISAEYPNTIVADWYQIIQDDPGLLHTDKTHPNMDGIAVYADLIATALEDLGPK